MSNNFFSYELPEGFSHFPKCFLAYLQLSRPHHFLAGVVPSLWGFHFASTQVDVLKWYLLFAVGAFLILGAGATINDIIDVQIDKTYYRTMSRPIPSGRIKKSHAYLFFLAQLLPAFIIWLYLPNTLKFMTLTELLLICIYPFLKRFLYISQVYLGFIAALPVSFSYYIFERAITPAIIFLVVSAAIICIIFDTFFEYSEYFHNNDIKAKSLALLIGSNPKTFFYVSSGICTICLAIAGYLAEKRLSYFVISVLAMIMLCRAIQKTDIRNQEECLRSFLSIQSVNLIILLGIFVSYYV